MKQPKIPFMEQTRFTNVLISVYTLVLIVVLFGRGLNYGIDFTGGHIMRLGFIEQEVTDKALRSCLLDKKIGLPANTDLVVQDVENIDKLKGYRSEKLIQLPEITSKQREKIFLVLAEKFGKVSKPDLESKVGPSIGEDMKKIAFLSIVFSIFLILIYMYYRFEGASAWGAVIALVHDALFTLGLLSFLGVKISLVVVAAILTVLGYSLNDSIVILDRIRENRKIYRKLTFFELVNLSLNQTLWRTILTTTTTTIPLLCLFTWGGSALRPFSTTLLIGVIAGTFSSIYVVSAWIVKQEGIDERPLARA
ncbi:protein translocase subunit SecF [Candidatus Riflebacteria bacterium]